MTKKDEVYPFNQADIYGEDVAGSDAEAEKAYMNELYAGPEVFSGRLDDEPLMNPFADDFSLVTEGDMKTDHASLNGNDFTFTAEFHSHGCRCQVTHVHHSADSSQSFLQKRIYEIFAGAFGTADQHRCGERVQSAAVKHDRCIFFIDNIFTA